MISTGCPLTVSLQRSGCAVGLDRHPDVRYAELPQNASGNAFEIPLIHVSAILRHTGLRVNGRRSNLDL